MRSKFVAESEVAMSDLYPQPHVGVSDPHGNIHKLDPRGSSRDYPDKIPPEKPAPESTDQQPGLVGGPATEAVPGSHETTPWEPLEGQRGRSATNPTDAKQDDANPADAEQDDGGT
jgi:hypothetical protein